MKTAGSISTSAVRQSTGLGRDSFFDGCVKQHPLWAARCRTPLLAVSLSGNRAQPWTKEYEKGGGAFCDGAQGMNGALRRLVEPMSNLTQPSGELSGGFVGSIGG